MGFTSSNIWLLLPGVPSKAFKAFCRGIHSLSRVTKYFIIFEVGLDEGNWCLNHHHAKFNHSVGKGRPTRPRFSHQSHVVTNDAVTEEEAFAQSESVGNQRRGVFLDHVSTRELSLLFIKT